MLLTYKIKNAPQVCNLTVRLGGSLFFNKTLIKSKICSEVKLF